MTGIIVGSSVTFLYGRSNIANSFVAQDLALTVANRGRTWLGREVRRSGSVLYLAGEGLGELKERIMVWLDARGVRREASDLYITDLGPQLTDERHIDHLVDRALRMRRALIVIDTLTSCVPGGEENNTTDMGLVVSCLRRLACRANAPVIVMHHAGKDPSKGMRCSNFTYAGADCVIKAHVNRKRRFLVSDNQRFAAGFEAIEFCLLPHDRSAVVSLPPDPTRKPPVQYFTASRQRVDLPSAPTSTVRPSAPILTGSERRVYDVLYAPHKEQSTFKTAEVCQSTGMPDTTVRTALRGLCRRALARQIVNGLHMRATTVQ